MNYYCPNCDAEKQPSETTLDLADDSLQSNRNAQVRRCDDCGEQVEKSDPFEHLTIDEQ